MFYYCFGLTHKDIGWLVNTTNTKISLDLGRKKWFYILQLIMHLSLNESISRILHLPSLPWVIVFQGICRGSSSSLISPLTGLSKIFNGSSSSLTEASRGLRSSSPSCISTLTGTSRNSRRSSSGSLGRMGR